MARKKQNKNADLRTCASCEWIFRLSDPLPKEKLEDGFRQGDCPQYQFGSYSAHYVYENRAYRYAISQKPWFNKKIDNYHFKLRQQIEKENPIKPKPKRGKLIKFNPSEL